MFAHDGYLFAYSREWYHPKTSRSYSQELSIPWIFRSRGNLPKMYRPGDSFKCYGHFCPLQKPKLIEYSFPISSLSTSPVCTQVWVAVDMFRCRILHGNAGSFFLHTSVFVPIGLLTPCWLWGRPLKGVSVARGLPQGHSSAFGWQRFQQSFSGFFSVCQLGMSVFSSVT